MQMSLYELLDQILAFIQNPHGPSRAVMVIIGILMLVASTALYIIWSARNQSFTRRQNYHRQNFNRHR